MTRIGPLELGETPAIVAAVTDRDLSGDCAGWAGLADVIELRVDAFTRPAVAHAEAVCRSARALGKPLLGTVRWSAEGGEAELGDPERLALYTAIAPLVDGLDVELRAPLRDTVVALARRCGALAMVSYHDFTTAPPTAALEVALADGRHADVVKIAVTTADTRDLARLADLLPRTGDQPRVVIAMGRAGMASRVFFPLLGSVLTYGFAGTPTAPGQLPLGELYDELRRYSPRFADTHPPRA
ncbi:MAG: type I 3-dehydroquinate dehydratase [Candidatus Binatia bacterium]